MKRFSSHYFLREDGTLGMFPVVEVDDNGSILSVTEYGKSFTETAAVSFYGGVMMPGFIAYFDSLEGIDSSTIRKLKLKGFTRFASNDNVNTSLSQLVTCVDKSPNLRFENVLPPFFAKEDLEKYIHNLTIERAEALCMYPSWGVLKAGSCPGIVVMEGLNLRTFEWTPTVRFRVLTQ